MRGERTRGGQQRGWIVGAGTTLLVALALVVPTAAQLPVDAQPAQVAENVELVGHSPILFRGLNSALALTDDYAYVGYRGDGTHADAGVAVIDVSDPQLPRTVNLVQGPEEDEPGESSRELRVWPGEDLLIVMDIPCSIVGHACYAEPAVEADAELNFYDVSADHADDPQLLHTYEPRKTPHEFFLWIDPDDPQRALVYLSTPSSSGDQMIALDISDAREGSVTEVASWAPSGAEDDLHSLSVHPDGTRAYLAHSEDGVLVLDTSGLAAGAADPSPELVTPLDQAPTWPGPGVHSVVKVPDRDLIWTTDESYGTYFGIPEALGSFESVSTGCPWTWARAVGVATGDPPSLSVAGEFKIHENTQAFCESSEGQLDSEWTSYSSHNPTVTEHLAIHSWYAGGLRVADTSDPTKPEEVGTFVPLPDPATRGDDPAVTYGGAKTAFWSYPVVQDGLIYVVDIRNGLYVLDYNGPHEDQVDTLDFLEGNSNRGDALGLYGVAP